VAVFIFSILLLFIIILLLTGYFTLKAIVFVFVVEIVSPYVEVIVSSLCIKICIASFDSATVTWSSASKSV
jgi:hypothetical protein